MKSWMVSAMALLLLGLATGARAEAKPTVTLNEADFRDRVFACWMGKNIGGTLGMPFEGKREAQNLTFYANLKKDGGPAANDDLDLQLLWLKAMEENNGRVDTRILGEYWMKFVPVDWNEYGVGKRNMKVGLLPPLSGEFNNAQWKPSNGAWIRSEIWACLAPGCPELAAKMAREDACVDHGAAEGTLAEIFTAAVESAAFIEHDRDQLIEIGLSMIPKECGVARAVRAAMAAKKAGKDWQAARLDVIKATEDTGWFQAPRNVAFTMIGWLYGDGDFGKSICIAVNCGDDTDCTGATLGSIFGIIYGSKGIPAKWSEPVGLKIKTVAISGFPAPEDLNVLTDHTVAMTKKVLAMNNAPVALSSGPTDLSQAGKLKLVGPGEVRKLWHLSPYQITWNRTDLQVILDYQGDPLIEAGKPRAIAVAIHNLSAQPKSLDIKLAGLPAGWKADGLPGSSAKIAAGKTVKFKLSLTADALGQAGEALAPADQWKGFDRVYKMTLQVTGSDQPLAVPVSFVTKAAAAPAK